MKVVLISDSGDIRLADSAEFTVMPEGWHHASALQAFEFGYEQARSELLYALRQAPPMVSGWIFNKLVEDYVARQDGKVKP